MADKAKVETIVRTLRDIAGGQKSVVPSLHLPNNSNVKDFARKDINGGLTDGNLIIGNSANNAAEVAVTGDVAITNAGVTTVSDLTIASEAAGDILYFNGSNWVRLGIGTASQVLQTNSGATAPEWATASSGGATNKMEAGRLAASQAETEVFTVTIAGMTAASACVKVYFHINDPTVAVTHTPKIRVSDGTNTTDLALNASSRQDGFINIMQDQTTNTQVSFMGHWYTGSSTVNNTNSNQGTMNANWITSSFTISLRIATGAAVCNWAVQVTSGDGT